MHENLPSYYPLQLNASFRENSSRNWRLSTLHCRHETSDHGMPKPAPLFQQKTMPLCCASSCLPLLARRGSLLAGSPRVQTPPSAAQSSSLFVQDQPQASPLLPRSLVLSSTALNLPLYIPVDLSLANRHGRSIKSALTGKIYTDYSLRSPLPTSTGLRWAFQGQ